MTKPLCCTLLPVLLDLVTSERVDMQVKNHKGVLHEETQGSVA